jgi:hypothetical protein
VYEATKNYVFWMQKTSNTYILLTSKTQNKECFMGPLNNLFNKVDGWCQPTNQTGEAQSILVRYGSTRAVSVLACAPLEALAVAENAFNGLAQGVTLPFQFLANTFSCISGSDCCDFITRGKSTVEIVSDFLATIYKVAAYAVGTVSTVILGFAAPAANLSLHSWAGLFDNNRETAIAVLEAQKIQEQLEAEHEQLKKEITAKREAEDVVTKAEQEQQEVVKSALEQQAIEAGAQKAELEKQAIEAAKLAEVEIASKAEEERLALEAAKQLETQIAVNNAQATPVAAAVVGIDEETVNYDIIAQTKPSGWRFVDPRFYWSKFPQIRNRQQAI